MKKILPAMLLVATLSGCSTVNKAASDLMNLDITGNSQAQQATTTRVAPLMVPPDYALRPVQVAPVRAADGGQEQVLDALFGGPAPRSISERAVLQSAGTAEAGIRTTVGDPETVTVNKGSVTRDIIAAPEGDGQVAQAAIPQ
jgi:Protein of unknown function (DUF3035)/Prokaryotic membrane lipoprotein lipid attachment site